MLTSKTEVGVLVYDRAVAYAVPSREEELGPPRCPLLAQEILALPGAGAAEDGGPARLPFFRRGAWRLSVNAISSPSLLLLPAPDAKLRSATSRSRSDSPSDREGRADPCPINIDATQSYVKAVCPTLVHCLHFRLPLSAAHSTKV
jgi:hypothetical protein